jgi:oxygen-independent coproporphyrinogen-3 oxidase
MERRVRRGELPEPNPDLAADMYLLAEGLLGRAGYHHYEISNWALPGYECLHNLTYWLNRPYLGVGAGAHSYLPPFRFHTTRSPRRHLRRVHRWAQRGPGRAERWDRDVVEGIAPLDGVEPIERRLEMAETMFLGLRLLDGLSLGLFRERFGVEATQVYGEQIEELTGLGLLEEGGGTLRLSPRGRLLANQVFMRFLG